MENINNPFAGKSLAELQRQAEYIRLEMEAIAKAEAKAKEAEHVRENIIAAAAFKWAYNVLQSRGKLGEKFADIPQQAFPREALLAKPADLSEAQVHGLKESAVKALMDLARG